MKNKNKPKKPVPLEARNAGSTNRPEPERLKIEGDWKDAVKTALRKPKPPGGRPK